MIWLTAGLGAAVTASILYVVLAPRFNYSIWRPLLFHPHPFEPGTDRAPMLSGIQGMDVKFNAGGRSLHGWYYRSPRTNKTILFSHGNAGNVSYRTAILELMLNSGASVLLYDYAGFGKSEGIPTLEGIVEDGLAAYDYLVKDGVDPHSIVLYGESLGAAVAVQISAQRACFGIVLQSGFSSLRRIALEIFPFVGLYPPVFFPLQQLDTVALLKKHHPPLLIIHGVLDQIVPFSHAESLFDAAVGRKKLVKLPSTDHNDISATAAGEYSEALKEFLCAAVEDTMLIEDFDK